MSLIARITMSVSFVLGNVLTQPLAPSLSCSLSLSFSLSLSLFFFLSLSLSLYLSPTWPLGAFLCTSVSPINGY